MRSKSGGYIPGKIVDDLDAVLCPTYTKYLAQGQVVIPFAAEVMRAEYYAAYLDTLWINEIMNRPRRISTKVSPRIFEASSSVASAASPSQLQQGLPILGTLRQLLLFH